MTQASEHNNPTHLLDDEELRRMGAKRFQYNPKRLVPCSFNSIDDRAGVYVYLAKALCPYHVQMDISEISAMGMPKKTAGYWFVHGNHICFQLGRDRSWWLMTREREKKE